MLRAGTSAPKLRRDRVLIGIHGAHAIPKALALCGSMRDLTITSDSEASLKCHSVYYLKTEVVSFLRSVLFCTVFVAWLNRLFFLTVL